MRCHRSSCACPALNPARAVLGLQRRRRQPHSGGRERKRLRTLPAVWSSRAGAGSDRSVSLEPQRPADLFPVRPVIPSFCSASSCFEPACPIDLVPCRRCNPPSVAFVYLQATSMLAS
ncbi:hypothetical protein KCP76_26035 (plasmid) [Salmonella enterica subsp. enterica serovar Weltevreden]|nr:hypothetical protein KCP76_26035 [Salmonella enterica subsp. enterica serovar Weltevreden]